MRWFDKFFSKDEHLHTQLEIPFSTITRWSLYDLSIDNPNQIALLLGLNPVSKEGEEKELEDSYKRLAALDELLPFIDVISDLNARIIVGTQQREFDEEFEKSISDDELDAMTDFYKAIGFSALVTAFSSGIELDILHTHALKLSTTYKEEEDEQ